MKRNYQKEYGYSAQKKYHAENYSQIGITVYKQRKEELVALAASKGISLSRLIIDAVETQYQIDLSKPRQSDDSQEFQSSTAESLQENV